MNGKCFTQTFFTDFIIAGTLLTALISGCSQTGLLKKPIEINKLIIRNETAEPLYEIKLKVEKTGTVVTCNYIGPGQAFSTEFPLRQYRGNSVRTNWQQSGRNFSTHEQYAEIPDDLDLNISTAVVITIHNNGTVQVRLEQ